MNRGQGLIEYMVAVVGVTVLILVAITLLGPVVTGVKGQVQTPPSLDDTVFGQNLNTASTTANVVTQLTVYEALWKLNNAINSEHFNRAKHQEEDPNPTEIRRMIELGLCNPIRVYECSTWTRRIKFVCPVTPGISAGLVISPDAGNGVPLAVTAFPAPSTYWDTLGISGCTLIGEVVHP